MSLPDPPQHAGYNTGPVPERMFNQWSQVLDYQRKFQNMNDFLERRDVVERNRKYKEELDRMLELKEQGKKSLKEQDYLELKQREKEATLLDQLEVQNKVNFRTRNNDMISKCLEEQAQVQEKARQAKRLEELEFQKKLQEMKEQEMLSKQQQKEYKDLVVRDMHENYEISKKVGWHHRDQRHRERARKGDGRFLRQA